MTTWAPDKRQGSSFTVWHHFPSSLRPFLSVPINVRSLFFFFFYCFLKADADSSVGVNSAHTFKSFKIQMQDAGFAVRFSLTIVWANITRRLWRLSYCLRQILYWPSRSMLVGARKRGPAASNGDSVSRHFYSLEQQDWNKPLKRQKITTSIRHVSPLCNLILIWCRLRFRVPALKIMGAFFFFKERNNNK